MNHDAGFVLGHLYRYLIVGSSFIGLKLQLRGHSFTGEVEASRDPVLITLRYASTLHRWHVIHDKSIRASQRLQQVVPPQMPLGKEN